MYSTYLRERIIHLSQTLTGRSLINALKEEGFNVSKTGVYYLIKKYKQHGIVHDLPRSGRPSILTDDQHKMISEWLVNNNELTINDIVIKLQARGINSSRSSVGRALKRMGWSANATRYCQLIREQNKQKRLDFCHMLLRNGDTFEDVIFTDEAMIQLKPAHRKSYHKKGQPRRFRPKPKHPVKVFVWGGISMKGATNVVIFCDIMDAQRYVDILRAGLLPFVRRKFPDMNFRFQQDNDPKHTSRVAKEFFSQEQITWWKTPAESPDLNPIERVWSHMKQFLTYTIKPCNKQELVDGIKTFWRQKLTIPQCKRYINHIHKVIPVIISKNGEAVVDDEIPR